MIYLVTNNQELFKSDYYTIISVEKSKELLNSCGRLQYDSETNGRDAHINDVLCIQFGNDAKDIRIVIDTTTIDIKEYKEILETHLIIGQNLKFDLQFLYNYGIIPIKVYDTMIAEQLLYLGYPQGIISYSLKSIADRRLHVNIDKTIRGEIIWRGLDSNVIQYSAGDVTYLEKIMESQIIDLQNQELLKAAELENNFVPAIAYLEWCGIHLDQTKWKEKMYNDSIQLKEAQELLNNFVINSELLKEFTYINLQGDLFTGFDTSPKCTINWDSPEQVIKVAKKLGFNTTVQDKKTGEDKDSVLEKSLSTQKGINDEFLKLYFRYKEYSKVVSSFGQGHLNAINPNTNRMHTIYKQLGTVTGRMSSGSRQSNIDLAKLKKINPKNCAYPNMQQLPADDATRGAFTSEENNKFVSCDFSALESRLGADIYQEPTMLKEFLEGSGDMHSLCAKMVFAEELKDVEIKDIKKVRPDLRKKVKSVEFNCGLL